MTTSRRSGRILVALSLVFSLTSGFSLHRLSSSSSLSSTAIAPSTSITTTQRNFYSYNNIHDNSKQHYNIQPSQRCLTRRFLITDSDVATELKNSSMQGNSNNNDTGGIAAMMSSTDSSMDSHEEYKGAILRTLLWVGAAVGFGAGLFVLDSPETSAEFFAGYLLEQSLSVDNLLVFLLLFEYFKIPMNYQNRVLKWGILGAVGMRAIMISLGAAALHEFKGVLLVFAGILIYSSVQVLLGGEEDEAEDFSENIVVQFSNKLIQSTSEFDGDNFFVEKEGIRLATPMLLCLVAVELSDVVFAVDSIPAVFGVTENPLVVFTSNMFAIAGLRSLYTILSKAASELKYLETAVAVILLFIGTKLTGEYFGYCIPTDTSLGVVATLLGGGVAASLLDDEDSEDSSE